MSRGKAALRPELAASRMKAIAKQLLDEMGSQSRVSDEMGLSRSYVAKLLGDQRSTVGEAAIAAVVLKLGIDANYFNDPSIDDLDFRKHVRSAASEHQGISATSTARGLFWFFGAAGMLAQTIELSSDPQAIAGMSKLLARLVKDSTYAKAVASLVSACEADPPTPELVIVENARRLAHAMLTLERVVSASPEAHLLDGVGGELVEILEALGSIDTDG